jgi:phytoene/squalene synthetase
VTDLGKQNAEIRERNRVLETARKAVEKAQELFSGLEKRARQAVGLARKIGQRLEQQREAERQRQELARQVEIRRQKEIWAIKDAQKAVESKPLHPQALERNQSGGQSRGRSKS